ncbi:MAG: alpha-hydroxy acid oxidase [Thermomicrobiales bacterium]
MADGMVARELREPLNVHEYEAAAREVLTPMAFDFLTGGAGDEVTLRENRAAFDRWRLLPRVMTGVGRADPATTVLGQAVSMPVLVAPTGLHRLFCPDGELASARAAKRAGTIFTLSMASCVPIEEVAPEAGPWWMQIYLYRDRKVDRDLIGRAEANGAAAVVLTVDTPVHGRREKQERHHFDLPEGVVFGNLLSAGLIAYGDHIRSLEDTLGWRDLDWLASVSSLPVIVKGVLHPDDARLAVEHGARAVLVSNHGGRQLDDAVAALDALPAVAAAVDGRAEVLLDGGVRRGADVLKALALGARAVLIGRPFLYGLAVAGEEGACRVLELLRDEVARALTLCGYASPNDIGRALVIPAGRGDAGGGC